MGATAPMGLDNELYRRLKVTDGGVMLLIRLHGDMCRLPEPRLRALVFVCKSPDPVGLLGRGSRLATTFAWIDRKFGRSNALRAVKETAEAILED